MLFIDHCRCKTVGLQSSKPLFIDILNHCFYRIILSMHVRYFLHIQVVKAKEHLPVSSASFILHTQSRNLNEASIQTSSH